MKALANKDPKQLESTLKEFEEIAKKDGMDAQEKGLLEIARLQLDNLQNGERKLIYLLLIRTLLLNNSAR